MDRTSMLAYHWTTTQHVILTVLPSTVHSVCHCINWLYIYIYQCCC